MDWFTKLETQEKTIAVLVILGLIYFMFINHNQFIWSVDSSEEWKVQVYPDSSGVKNYELPADMEITEHSYGLIHNKYSYQVQRAVFPNEGYLEFNSCYVAEEEMKVCRDQKGDDWGVKVPVTPDRPSADYDSDY